MLEEDKILVISKPGVEGYSLLAKLASKHNNITWIASSPYIPSKILESYSYSNVKLLSFSPMKVSPINLNEISIAISHSGGKDSCVTISCISELIMYHGVTKVYHFLLNITKNTKKLLCMMIDGAQERKDEFLISTLFDAVFRLEKKLAGDDWEIRLIPEIHIQNRMYRLKYAEGVVEIYQSE